MAYFNYKAILIIRTSGNGGVGAALSECAC